MNRLAKRHHTIGTLTPQPAGPAEAAGVLCPDTQSPDFLSQQCKTYVVIKKISLREPHQGTERLIPGTLGEKLMKAVPAQSPDVDTKPAASVSNPLTQNSVVTELTIGLAQEVALFRTDVNDTFGTLLDEEISMLEVITQNRLDQGRRVDRKSVV